MTHDSVDAAEASARAGLYLLHGLIQRLESRQPGLAQDLLKGVKADHTAVEQSGQIDPLVNAIFVEATTVLTRVCAQNQMRED